VSREPRAIEHTVGEIAELVNRALRWRGRDHLRDTPRGRSQAALSGDHPRQGDSGLGAARLRPRGAQKDSGLVRGALESARSLARGALRGATRGLFH
jgi:hypothetical protein